MSTDSVTFLLQRFSAGDRDVEGELMQRVYGELHQLAAAYMRRERSDHTLQPTALVNEAYLRLIGQQEIDWASRQHFFVLAAKVMRRILTDHARKKNAAKRGGGTPLLPIEAIDKVPGAGSDDDQIVELDEALTRFAELFPRQAKVVELRYFSGIEQREIAATLEVSERTVKRDWDFAQAWLHRELKK